MRPSLCCFFVVLIVGCGQQHAASVPQTPHPGSRVFTLASAPAPAAGQLTRTTVHESTNVVSQVLRLAPGAEIATHHHPVHDETFFVHAGAVEVSLNGEPRQVNEGTVVHIPANTVIQGRNGGSVEAVIVVVFATTGKSGPLTVPGASHP